MQVYLRWRLVDQRRQRIVTKKLELTEDVRKVTKDVGEVT